MSERVKHVIEYCKKNRQEHLVEYLKPVFSQKSDILAKQIIKTDFVQINTLYSELIMNNKNDDCSGEEILLPMKSFDIKTATDRQKDELNKMGLDSIRRGEVAAITMAGGQGTRLGHPGPKGTFTLETNPPKSLFEIQCERLMKIYSITDIFIPWLIMTSEENNSATEEFFKQHNYFGYDSSKIKFFPQEMIPIIDFDGKVIVNETGLAVGPNGNGGIFSSLQKSGKYQWLKEQGIMRVFVCGVDNVLVKVADPLFIGFSIQSESEIACKSALKRSYDEKAGVFCFKNDKPSYVEYTEISEEQSKSKDENGEYLFGDIGIVMYVFHMDVLDKIASIPLPYHIAKKKTSLISPNGEIKNPTQANSIKFETFIFDSFQMVDKISVLRVLREEEFAPIKNKTGEDSPQTALNLYEGQY